MVDKISSKAGGKEKQERKEKGKKRVEEIIKDEREKIKEENDVIEIKILKWIGVQETIKYEIILY